MATNASNTETVTVAPEAEVSVGQLPFTGRRPDDSGINLWSPAEPGDDWGAQCRVGRDYGAKAIDYIRSTGDAAALGGIVRTIAERGTFGGVEVGFFAAISMSLAEV